MKIKVKFEQIYDSDKFYAGYSPEELEQITFEQFKEGIVDDMYEYPEFIVDSATFELIKE